MLHSMRSGDELLGVEHNCSMLRVKLIPKTRMHSSRTRTARSSSCHGGLHTTSPLARSPSSSPWVWAWTRSPSTSPLGVSLDQILINFPLGCGPGPDPPQLPPWVGAWTRSLSTSPLGVGLDQIPLNFPLGCGPGEPPSPEQAPPQDQTPQE